MSHAMYSMICQELLPKMETKVNTDGITLAFIIKRMYFKMVLFKQKMQIWQLATRVIFEKPKNNQPR